MTSFTPLFWRHWFSKDAMSAVVWAALGPSRALPDSRVSTSSTKAYKSVLANVTKYACNLFNSEIKRCVLMGLYKEVILKQWVPFSSLAAALPSEQS